MTRRLGLPPLLLALLMLMAAGCGEGGGQVKQASTWLPKAKQFVQEARAGSSYQRLRLGDDAARGRVGRLVKEAPTSPSVEEAAELRRLIALRSFYSNVDAAAEFADLRMFSAESAVEVVAKQSLTTRVERAVVDHLVENGTKILKDAACDLAWTLMKEAERVTVNESLYGQGYTRKVPDVIKELGKLVASAAINAIANHAKATFQKLYTPASVVNWRNYATGLYKKANDVVGNGDTPLNHPDGTVTRALIYYARLCLRPPK